MAKRCTRCGNFLMDDERFCTRCGENVSNVMPDPVQPNPADNAFGRNDGYVSPGSQPAQQYGQPYTYAQPSPAYNNTNSEEMSLGKWVGTIIVTTFFGLISFIFLLVWGFGDGPESRKRYCKAMLIVELISVGLAIVFMIIFVGLIGAGASSFSNYINDYIEEYGQYAAVSLAPFFGM